jgi:hypothetical protein
MCGRRAALSIYPPPLTAHRSASPLPILTYWFGDSGTGRELLLGGGTYSTQLPAGGPPAPRQWLHVYVCVF